MKKLIFSIFVFILFISFSYSEEEIIIGLSTPYIRNKSAETVFYQKNFPFELLFNYSDDYYSLDLLNVDLDKNEAEYLKGSKREAIRRGFDYLLHSVVYSSKTHVFFKVQILNPYTDNVLFNKLYSKKIDFAISEFLTECSVDLINGLKNLGLAKIKRKMFNRVATNDKENDNEDKIEEFVTRYKHEIFFLNAFFKNHASTMSFLELFTGYNFSPFNFFNAEAAMFLGGGSLDKTLDMNNIGINKFYIGWSLGFNFYLPNIVEPSIGLRFEINYISQDAFYFTIPLDIGLKIYVNPKNAIRFNASFQFTALNLNRVYYKVQPWWENNYMIGFMIGYAKKI